MSTNSSLVSQVGHLQKQLAFYKGLVNQHQDFFVEVYHALDAESSGHLAALQKKCRTLSTRAKAKTAGGGAGGGNMNEGEEVQHQQPPGGLPDTLEIQSSVVSAVADEASKRIQAATVKLLNLWSDHIKANVQSLLGQPDQAFDVFHETPTNESLELFLSTYRHSAQGIRELLHVGQDGDLGVQQVKGPQGNPFEMDARLLSLYKVTITEAFDARCTMSTGATSAAAAAPSSTAKSTAPIQMESGAFGSSPQQKQRASSSRRPMARAPQVTHQTKAQAGWDSSPVVDHEDQAVAEDQRMEQRRGQQQQPPQRPAINRPPVAPLDTGSLHQTPAPLHAQQQQQQSQPRVGTPRHSKRSNDSNQMAGMLGAGAGGEGGDFGSRPGTPHVPFESLPRMAQLKMTLQQLEVQLGAISTTGKDTGSEAKYYALTKKLQRVRAEVLKEQREVEAVTKSQREQENQRNQRDDRRRAFNR